MWSFIGFISFNERKKACIYIYIYIYIINYILVFYIFLEGLKKHPFLKVWKMKKAFVAKYNFEFIEFLFSTSGLIVISCPFSCVHITGNQCRFSLPSSEKLILKLIIFLSFFFCENSIQQNLIFFFFVTNDKSY